MLKINEIFYSIQGESTFAGFPFIFIRLTGCPLRCTWCDTTYAYNEGTDMDLPEIMDTIKKYPGHYVEITGGEPLQQKDTPQLAAALLDHGYDVFMETGGSHDISIIPENVHRIMDIKCPASGMTDKMDWKNLHRLGKNDEIKFVIAGHKDFNFAEEIVKKNKQLLNFPLLISPVWGRVELNKLSEWILGSEIPFRLQLQLHKIIWPGVERGV